MARQIFRKEALDHLSSPEQLDQLIEVTRPRSWIALAAVGLLLLTVLAWGFTGSVPTTVKAKGILLRRGGIKPLVAPEDGIVTKIAVISGDAVKKGHQLLLLEPSGPARGKPLPIISPFSARVLQRLQRDGARVKKGETLLMLEDLSEPLRARLFIPVSEGYQVQRGMEVQVSPSHVKKSDFGYLVGKVIAAVKFPISHEDLNRIVKSEELIQQVTNSGPCLQVVVELVPDADTASGYHWSSSRGASQQLYGGSPCEGRIIVRDQRPIQLVFPSLGTEGTP